MANNGRADIATVGVEEEVRACVRFNERKFAIIGGTTKAGTTSLFTYLSAHPDVHSSSIKETRFFLDESYPLPRKSGYSGDFLAYSGFFPGWDQCPERVLLEATPDYMYSVTASQIAGLLPGARMILILRDPIERVESWYRFAKQRGMLDPKISIDDYVRIQFENKVDLSTPVHLRALEQGRYAPHVARMRRAFGDRLIVCDFKDLQVVPRQLMARVCEFLGLSFEPFVEFDFGVENKSEEVRIRAVQDWYINTRRFVSYSFISRPRAMRVMRGVSRFIKPLMRLNTRPACKDQMSREVREQLKRYYSSEELARDGES